MTKKRLKTQIDVVIDTNYEEIETIYVPLDVVIDTNYKEIETVYVPSNFTKKQIREYLHEKYGKTKWFAYDI